MHGIAGRKVLEVSHSPESLDQDGFWAIHVTYEGEWTCVRLGEITYEEFPKSEWKVENIRWESSFQRAEYIAYVERIRNAIESGKVYQVNACRVLSRMTGNESLKGLFSALLRENPAPFACYFNFEGIEIASASPERFLSISTREGETVGETVLKTSPIKGTSSTLHFGEKDKSENVMIVDLMRNDLSSICKFGSVEVSRLLGVEPHPGLFHLVSDVVGSLEKPLSHVAEILPAGSISGAPKSSAIQIIKESESARGSYCGILGYIDRDGDEISGELSVGIRLFCKKGSELSFGTGAGITWASSASEEWDETELKARHLVSIAGGDMS